MTDAKAPVAARLVVRPITVRPITVTRAELEWARAHPLGLFDRLLDDHRRAAARDQAALVHAFTTTCTT